ncbi:MAG: hypothetical protein AB7U18_21620 [Dehalococcoidia bacterium]
MTLFRSRDLPRLILFTLMAMAIVLALVTLAGTAQAQQPSEDGVDIDQGPACLISVEFIDGTEDTETIEIFVNDIRTANIVFNDVVGDQSQIVATFTAEPGDEILARVTANEDEYEDTLTVADCPTPTATPTSTATATPTKTATPIPTSTAAPPAPTATPIVITNTITNNTVTERVVEVPGPVVTRTIIQPPSTGDGGLVTP